MNLHPSPDRLSAFALHPDDTENVEWKSHVETCAQCCAQVKSFSRLISALRHPVNTDTATPVGGIHLSAEQRQRYVALPAADQPVAWREHIRECEDCRAAILLLRARRAAGNTTLSSSPSSDPVTTKDERLNNVVSLQAPWRHTRLALPVALAAGFLLAVLLLPLFDRGTTPESIFFNMTAESPTLLFSPQHPSSDLGFVNAQNGVPFKGLVLSAEKEAFVARWEPVPEANQYTLRLFLVQGLTQTDVFRGESATNTLRLPRNALRADETYRWELSGTTRNQIRFGIGGTILWGAALP